MKKNCPICDELIDEHAQECPYCHEQTGFPPSGQPVRGNESNALQWVIIVLLVIAISVLFYFLFRPMPGYQGEPVEDELVTDSDEVAEQSDTLKIMPVKPTKPQQSKTKTSGSNAKRSLTEKEKQLGEQYYEPAD